MALSTLGFLAANPAVGISLPQGIDASMIGVQTVATLLPTWGFRALSSKFAVGNRHL